MQFGKKGTEEWNVRRDLFEDVIKRAVEESVEGFTCVRADDIDSTGSIPADVIDCTANARIVIADLSDHNPNVMYELGIRHSFRHGTVLMAREGTLLPFDTNTERTVFYSTATQQDREHARKELSRFLKRLREKSDISDSPVIRVVGSSKITPHVTSPHSSSQAEGLYHPDPILGEVWNTLTLQGFASANILVNYDEFRIFWGVGEKAGEYFAVLWSVSKDYKTGATLACFRRALGSLDTDFRAPKEILSKLTFVVPSGLQEFRSERSVMASRLEVMRKRSISEDYLPGHIRRTPKALVEQAGIEVWDVQTVTLRQQITVDMLANGPKPVSTNVQTEA